MRSVDAYFIQRQYLPEYDMSGADPAQLVANFPEVAGKIPVRPWLPVHRAFDASEVLSGPRQPHESKTPPKLYYEMDEILDYQGRELDLVYSHFPNLSRFAFSQLATLLLPSVHVTEGEVWSGREWLRRMFLGAKRDVEVLGTCLELQGSEDAGVRWHILCDSKAIEEITRIHHICPVWIRWNEPSSRATPSPRLLHHGSALLCSNAFRQIVEQSGLSGFTFCKEVRRLDAILSLG